jgi:glutathione S-transferase
MSITVFGEGRGFRVIWLLEEMGLTYQLRPVNLLAGAANDPEFLAVNPAGFIPALVDGDVTMVESIAIMQYLVDRYGPTPLAPEPQDPSFPLYQQFLHLGEAGLMGLLFFVFADRVLAPEAARHSWTGNFAEELFESRRGLVARQLARSPYMAGDSFTAADISVTYALEFGKRTCGLTLDQTEQDYLARTTVRDGYVRAMDACKDTKAWVASMAAQ